jgi:hypothetical protein
MRENTSGGAICGGVISDSQHRKNVEEYGVWADTMSWVMPDDKYEQYVALKQAGKNKQATKLFDRHASLKYDTTPTTSLNQRSTDPKARATCADIEEWTRTSPQPSLPTDHTE